MNAIYHIHNLKLHTAYRSTKSKIQNQCEGNFELTDFEEGNNCTKNIKYI